MLKLKIIALNSTKCFSRVADPNICWICGSEMIKHGTTNNGNQRFRCKNCSRTRVKNLSPNGYGENFNSQIVQLKKEGLGIRSVSRVLKISPATVIRKILSAADKMKIPQYL